MIPKEYKRLAEIDFPLAAVNEACIRENNRKTQVDSGHLSLLHSWWARQPLASCRALLLTLLLPNPADPRCPESFKDVARKELKQLINIGPSDTDLRQALLSFVAELAEWDLGGKTVFISAARRMIQAAYGTAPHVFDPFSGGGSIPLEGLRLGCEVTAAELNPVAWLLLKIALEWCGRQGPDLAALFQKWSTWVLSETERRLAPCYPLDREKRKPLAYLWARTVRCEAPGCGVTIPLVRDLWLSKASSRKKAIRILYPSHAKEPTVESYSLKDDRDVGSGTVAGFRATCPKCRRTTPKERVQAQLQNRHGGAGDSILLAVVRTTGGRGKDYYPPTAEDFRAYAEAQAKANNVNFTMASFPQNDTRAFPPALMGSRHGIIFPARSSAAGSSMKSWKRP